MFVNNLPLNMQVGPEFGFDLITLPFFPQPLMNMVIVRPMHTSGFCLLATQKTPACTMSKD